MVPRGEIEVPCLIRVAMGPAGSFPLGTQTSRTLPGSVVLIITHALSPTLTPTLALTLAPTITITVTVTVTPTATITTVTHFMY